MSDAIVTAKRKTLINAFLNPSLAIGCFVAEISMIRLIEFVKGP